MDAPDRLRSVKAWLDIVERKPPAFEPGTKWEYNNLGFVVLGRVIEIVTGEDYYDYVRKHVFVPAGYKSEYPYDKSGKMPGGDTFPIPDPVLPLAYVAARTSARCLARRP